MTLFTDQCTVYKSMHCLQINATATATFNHTKHNRPRKKNAGVTRLFAVPCSQSLDTAV